MIKQLILILLLGFLPFKAMAGVTVVQALSFGSWISKNNNAQYDITINTNGTYSFDSSGFIEIAAPQEGIFDIDGLPVSTAIASVVVTQTIPLSASGENFQMVSLQEAHPASTTAGGVAQITVGGTARTSGSTISYLDNTYNGQLEIQINF
ncbi:MAG: hypothetical protein OEY94_05955 [Alphaproteobacteria bacterium]|nr:hypothetical protein [Alphaproteobacteria bacterium]